jgi:formylglycine-generating enzyme required for sulfatase activity
MNDMLAATAPALEHSTAARLVREGGWHVSLPSELEWEKAARGRLRDAVFSWGDTPDPNRANYSDSKIGNSTAAGCFPPNGFGLHDMIGNVWEWTRSLWGKNWSKPDFGYPYDPDDRKREDLNAGNDVSRVVRGGSWYYDRDLARCAFRGKNLPDDRIANIGFRVVVRSAPVP